MSELPIASSLPSEIQRGYFPNAAGGRAFGKEVEDVRRYNDEARVARIRLKSLFQILHFRKRIHLTIRDVRSVLAFALFGKKTCIEIEKEIQAGDTDFKDADRLQDCAIVGQNGSIEARLQMRKPNSRLIGSVAYFPERYGGQLVGLALDMLTHRVPVPNAVFIKHQLITPNNLQQHYGRKTQPAKSA